MAETKNEKFKRLATYRTNRVLERLRILGNLSNRSNYDYTQDEVKKIFGAIEEQLGIVKMKFKQKDKKKFTWD